MHGFQIFYVVGEEEGERSTQNYIYMILISNMPQFMKITNSAAKQEEERMVAG